MIDNGEAKLSTVDYVIMAVVLFLSAGSGLSVSLFKRINPSLVEYFLAGRNASVPLILLSFFATVTAGGMLNIGVEIYSFGTQIMLAFILFNIVGSLWLHYVIVPVFYKMQNISMLKYFELRFGAQVHKIALVAIVFEMVAIAAVNLYVVVVIVHQVSNINFWMTATITATVCVIYSTLGGMRGILLADAFQAVVMIMSVVGIFVASFLNFNDLSDIWRINNEYGRLRMFDFRFDPTLPHTFWSSIFGYLFHIFAHVSINQTIIQRCVMAPTFKSAQRIAVAGNIMTQVYCSAMQALGLVIFAYYRGCNLVQIGSISNFNHLVTYYAMEILHKYKGFPGLFFSGVLCATLSTISSLLNSISAVIMVQLQQSYWQLSERLMTRISKLLVVIFGIFMMLGLLVMERFQNVTQAAVMLISVIGGPLLGIFCLGIFCPQVNRTSTTISLVFALIFGFWQLIGMMLVTYQTSLPFAACNSTKSSFVINNMTNNSVKDPVSSFEPYFPLAKISYSYMSLELVLVTVVLSILLTHVLGPDTARINGEILDLTPACVKSIQKKMSQRLRRIFLCDLKTSKQVDLPLVNIKE